MSTGSLSEGRVWQLGAVYDISIGIGGGFGGTINSDGSFTGGFEGSKGGGMMRPMTENEKAFFKKIGILK